MLSNNANANRETRKDLLCLQTQLVYRLWKSSSSAICEKRLEKFVKWNSWKSEAPHRSSPDDRRFGCRRVEASSPISAWRLLKNSSLRLAPLMLLWLRLKSHNETRRTRRSTYNRYTRSLPDRQSITHCMIATTGYNPTLAWPMLNSKVMC
jgi:hypothetical protein